MPLRARDAFLIVFLASQVALPLHYYVIRTAPPESYDERFAWRMFSPVRMLRCSYSYAVDGEKISLGSRVHVAWSSLLKRGRGSVVDAVGAHLCQDADRVTVTLTCKAPGESAQTIEDGARDLCAVAP